MNINKVYYMFLRKGRGTNSSFPTTLISPLLYYINQQNNKKKLKYQQERMNNIVKQYYLLYNNQKKANLNKQLDNLVKLYYSHYLYKFNKKYKVYIFEQQQIKINNVQRESTAINPLMTYNGCGDTLNNNVLITINDVNNSVYIGDVITNVNNKKYYKLIGYIKPFIVTENNITCNRSGFVVNPLMTYNGCSNTLISENTVIKL